MSVAAEHQATNDERETGLWHNLSRRKVVVCLVLVVGVLLLYNAVSHGAFLNYDDDHYVVGNKHVREGLSGSTIRWAFTSLEEANWHPLTWLSHALDCQLFHLNPSGHHYLNLLLHAANVVLLFLILQWFTGYTGRSLMVAALFAIHPINVESVAWVAERKNVLSMLFFLLAIGAYGWYVRRPGIARYLSVVALFALGLMAKPMVITLPLVLLLLDYWPLGRMKFRGDTNPAETSSQGGVPSSDNARSLFRLSLEKIPLLLLALASAVVTMVAQKAGGAVASITIRTPWLRVENAIVCYVRYLGKAIWPRHLAALYPYPDWLAAWQVMVSALVLLLVSAAVLRYRKCRYLLTGWLWFLGTLVPMIGLIQVGNQAMADRYAYLPFIGLFIMVGWGLAEWSDRRGMATQYVAAGGVVSVVALGAVTFVQVQYWHDDYTLWTHALAVTERNFVAENNFARALTQRGREEEAVAHFRAAAAIEPNDPVSQINLGIYAENHGDLKQATTRYQQVLALTQDAELRASAFANLGTIFYAMRDYAHAKQNFDSALKLGFEFPAVLLDSGVIAQKAGDLQRATDFYARFAADEPSDVAYLLLAQALERSGRSREAEFAAQQAQRLSSNPAQAHKIVAQLLGN
jgi:tetratricopeptide (TPR) repeat protein